MKQNILRLRQRYHQYFPEIAIVLFALILRLPLLGGSFWLDEAAQALESARPLTQQLEIIPDFQPPLMHIITHFAMDISNSEWWLRTIGALIPGLITVWATYRIGKKLICQYGAIAAALLLASSSFHIFYSQELRPYSLAAMFATLGWLILISWQDYKPRTSLILFAVTTALGLYSTYLYPFVLIGQVVYMLYCHRSFIKGFITSLSLSILAFTPWLPMFLRQLEEGQYVRKSLPGWESVVSLPQLKALPLTFGKFVYGVVNLEFNASYLFPTLLILLLFSVLLANNYWQDREGTLKFIKTFSIWLILPLLISWIISFYVPVIRPKRLLFLLPVMYLFISSVITPYFSRSSTSLRGGLAVLFSVVLILINIGGAFQYFTNPQLQREPWRRLYREVTQKYSPEETVAVYSFPAPFAPMRWYDTKNLPSISQGTLHVDRVENLPETIKGAVEYRYIVVFDYLTDLTDPERKLLATLTEFGYHEIDRFDYPNIGFVRILSRTDSVTAQVQE